MEITKDDSIKQWAIVEIQNNWGTDSREGIHLTDLLTPRKKFWSIIKPMKPAVRDILTWLPGIHVESRLRDALRIQKGEQKVWNEIYYTPDFFFNFPVELKSRRRNLAAEGNEQEDYDWYIRQVRGYCAVEDVRQGWLIVLSFVQKVDQSRKTEPALEFYRLEFTDDELIEERHRLTKTANLLETVIEEWIVSDHTLDNHDLLPACPSWMCGREIKEIKTKPRCFDCRRDFESDSGLQRHLKSAKGKDHKHVMATYDYSHEPTCKYYDVCRGKEKGNAER